MIEALLLPVAAFYLLWALYIIVMSLQRARRDGTLSMPALILGAPLIVAGVALDAILNLTIMSAVMLERPKEWLVTARLKRHCGQPTWRGAIARWMCQNLLDTFDPDGRHC
jgi:hypothetical protein